MAVIDRAAIIRQKLEGLERYAQLVTSNSFTEETLDELKTNAQSLCDEVKAEADLIKTDIGEWS